MCIAAPGQVVKIQGRKATIKYPKETRIAMVGDEEIKKGDLVMVQMGIVVRKLSAAEAKQSLEVWKEN